MRSPEDTLLDSPDTTARFFRNHNGRIFANHLEGEFPEVSLRTSEGESVTTRAVVIPFSGEVEEVSGLTKVIEGQAMLEPDGSISVLGHDDLGHVLLDQRREPKMIEDPIIYQAAKKRVEELRDEHDTRDLLSERDALGFNDALDMAQLAAEKVALYIDSSNN